jgi:predicted transcriptional regulator
MSARLDGARFRHELRIRAVTAGAVAKVARVSPNTVTRCLSGAPIRESTLREVIRALMSMPVMRGSELVAVETSTTMTSDVGS